MRFIALFLLISFSSFSQDTTKYFKSADYGWNWQRGKFRANLITPSDTVSNKLGVAQIGSSFYVHNGVRWVSVGSNLDTTSLSNRINAKLNISDTSSMLLPYLRKVDTASLSNRINAKGNGTVTSITAGFGLSGGTITSTGTIAVDTSNISILSRQRAGNTYLPLTGGTLTNRLTGTSLVLNKDSLPITSTRIWGLVVDTSNGNLISRQLLPTAATPTATIGLIATNGTATTFMRSDAAPALSQSIAPTWTGFHTFSRSATASGAIARGTYYNHTLTAAANSDVLVNLDINSTFTNGAFTGVANLDLRTSRWANFGTTNNTGIVIGSTGWSGGAPLSGLKISLNSGTGEASYNNSSGGGFWHNFYTSATSRFQIRDNYTAAAGRVVVGSLTDDATNALQITGALAFKTVAGKLNFTTGTNASVGTATLSSGTVTVNTTAVTASSIIFLTVQETGTQNGRMRVSAKVAGTSFTITSSDSGDNCVVAYQIIN